MHLIRCITPFILLTSITLCASVEEQPSEELSEGQLPGGPIMDDPSRPSIPGVLSLIEEGLITAQWDDPLKSEGIVALAIKQRSLLKFKELKEMLNALLNAIDGKGTSYDGSRHHFFEVCRSYLNYLKDADIGVAVDEDLKRNLADLLAKMNVMIEKESSWLGGMKGSEPSYEEAGDIMADESVDKDKMDITTNDLVKGDDMNIIANEPENEDNIHVIANEPMSEEELAELINLIKNLLESLNVFISKTDFEEAEDLMESIRFMKLVRTGLHGHFRLNPNKLGTIRTKLDDLDKFLAFTRRAESAYTPEILERIAKVHWLFSYPSFAGRLIGEEDISDEDLKSLREELGGLARKSLKYDLGELLVKEFTVLNDAFITIPPIRYRLRADSLNPRIMEVTRRVAADFDDFRSDDYLFTEIWKVYEEIHDACREIQKSIAVHGNTELRRLPLRLKIRELADIRMVFIIYLLRFETRPSDFKNIYEFNCNIGEGHKLDRLLNWVVFSLFGAQAEEYIASGNPKGIPRMQKIIKALYERIDEVLATEIPLHRRVLLGMEDDEEDRLSDAQLGEVRNLLFISYSEQFQQYWREEGITLENIPDNDHAAVFEVCNRVKAVEGKLKILYAEEWENFPCEDKGAVLDIIILLDNVTSELIWPKGGLDAMLPQGVYELLPRDFDVILPTNINPSLVGFYHRYVFTEINRLIDPTGDAIDEAIKRLKYYFRGGEEGTDLEPRATTMVSSMGQSITTATQFLDTITSVLSLPGLSEILTPLEDRLRKLPKHPCPKHVSVHEYLDQMQVFLMNVLVTLESWKTNFAYLSAPDFFEILDQDVIPSQQDDSDGPQFSQFGPIERPISEQDYMI